VVPQGILRAAVNLKYQLHHFMAILRYGILSAKPYND